MIAASSENVADLIAKAVERYIPEPRYVSKYRDEIRRASKRGKSAHKTLGVPNVSLDPPEQYLRKRSSSGPKKPQISHEHYHRPDYPKKLPSWRPVKASEREKRLSSDNSIDFKKQNIEDAIKLKPTEGRDYYVDDRHGNAHPLRPSGLFPLYRDSKNNGQPGDVSPIIKRHSIPRRASNQRRSSEAMSDESIARKKHENPTRRGTAVSQRENDKSRVSDEREDSTRRGTSISRRDENDVSRRKSRIRRSTKKLVRDKYETNADSRTERKSSKADKNGGRASTANTDGIDYQQPRCRYVTEDERAELLHGMKMKWDEMMKKFQCLPFLTDTPPKANRRSKMEKDLSKLENDIETIERHPYIYVYSDPED